MKFAFAPEATPLAGYTIKRAIDRGGFGEVYYALSDSGKEVALKLLQRNQQVELRGVSQCLNLKHPNLVTIFDIRTDAEGDHWVVMEYVSGKSLEAVLDEHPQGLPLAEVEDWLAGIAAGTAFLHDRGIVHRDLKPANVFRENGVVKIGDVGLSKFITPSRRSAQTESVGTVYYMAPEVARGKYGSELDVYSLGVMLYEMLTGHVPFTGESTGEILMKHLTEPPDLEKIPMQFRAVVGRALEKDPQRRTPGAGQLLDEFRRARQGKPLADEIPASHFVDVPRLERNASLKHDAAANGRAGNAHAATAHYPPAVGSRASNPFPLPQPPAPPPPLGRRPGQPAVNGWERFVDEIRQKPWLGALILVGVLMVFPRVALGRSAGTGIFELFALAGVSYVTYLVVTKVARGPQASPATPQHGAASVPPRPAPNPPVVQPVARQIPPSPPATRKPAPRPLTPETPRPIALRQRLSDLSGSMTMAVVWSALATAAVGSFFNQHLPLRNSVRETLATPAGMGLFGMATILGSWAILASSKFWEGSAADARQRRFIQTALGAAVGACAYWLQQTLLIDLGYHNEFPGLIKHISSVSLLTEAPEQPSLAGYVLFFAALFGIRRWWWQADAFRSKRFRVGSLMFSGLVAFLIPAAFAFHQEWGALWGIAISSVVQLSAPWIAPKERPTLFEANRAA
jgi:serine/threonine protein kinase